MKYSLLLTTRKMLLLAIFAWCLIASCSSQSPTEFNCPNQCLQMHRQCRMQYQSNLQFNYACTECLQLYVENDATLIPSIIVPQGGYQTACVSEFGDSTIILPEPDANNGILQPLSQLPNSVSILDGKLSLAWKYPASASLDDIQLTLQGQTDGWIGFGIADPSSSDGQHMLHSDAYIGLIVNEQTVVKEYTIKSVRNLECPDGVCVDINQTGQQSNVLLSYSRVNGIFEVKFRRLLSISDIDPDDYNIIKGVMRINLAMGTTLDKPNYHGANKMSVFVQLLAGAADPNEKIIGIPSNPSLPTPIVAPTPPNTIPPTPNGGILDSLQPDIEIKLDCQSYCDLAQRNCPLQIQFSSLGCMADCQDILLLKAEGLGTLQDITGDSLGCRINWLKDNENCSSSQVSPQIPCIGSPPPPVPTPVPAIIDSVVPILPPTPPPTPPTPVIVTPASPTPVVLSPTPAPIQAPTPLIIVPTPVEVEIPIQPVNVNVTKSVLPEEEEMLKAQALVGFSLVLCLFTFCCCCYYFLHVAKAQPKLNDDDDDGVREDLIFSSPKVGTAAIGINPLLAPHSAVYNVVSQLNSEVEKENQKKLEQQRKQVSKKIRLHAHRLHRNTVHQKAIGALLDMDDEASVSGSDSEVDHKQVDLEKGRKKSHVRIPVPGSPTGFMTMQLSKKYQGVAAESSDSDSSSGDNRSSDDTTPEKANLIKSKKSKKKVSIVEAPKSKSPKSSSKKSPKSSKSSRKDKKSSRK